MSRKRLYGTGTIFKRQEPDGTTRWVARQSIELPDGTRKTVTAYGKNEREAKRKLQAKVKDALAAAPQSTMTVAQFLDYYLEQREAEVIANNLSIRSLETYETSIRTHLKPHLGRIPLKRLNAIHISKMLNDIMASRSPASARRVRDTLRNALEYAIEWRLLASSPMPKRLNLRGNPKPQELWTEDEVVRFLQASRGYRIYALFYTSIMSGVRQGELLGVRWSDLEIDGQPFIDTVSAGGHQDARQRYRPTVIHIRRSLKHVSARYLHLAHRNKQLEHLTKRYFLGPTKTPRSQRSVEVAPDVTSVLVDHLHDQLELKIYNPDYRDYGLVFATSNGTPYDYRNIRATLQRTIKRAGVSTASFHDQRDLHASLLIARGVDIANVSERLGHSRSSLTWDRYVRPTAKLKQRASMSLKELLELEPDEPGE